MTNQITNKTAIVTGATKGIGRAIANELASNGYNLGLVARTEQDLVQTMDELEGQYGIKALIFTCDVTDKNAAKEILNYTHQRFGSLDVLVNNAGVNSRKTFSIDLEDIEPNMKGFRQEIETNLIAPFTYSLVAAHYMAQQKSGHIINISSIKGIESTSSPGYGASKAGLIKLTKDFATALAEYNIRVNCIVPGFIDCGMTSELPSEKQKTYKAQIPLGRFGRPEEVAKAVTSLIESTYETGQVRIIDGGYLK